MILRLLRLFPQFRALEEDRDATVTALREANQQLTTERLILQDRLDSQIESVSRLWSMTESAQQRAYAAMEMQVNFATQQKFGVTTYPDAAHLPPSTESSIEKARPFGSFQSPSGRVGKATADFIKQYAASHLNQNQ